MTALRADAVRKLMETPELVRNITVIAHVDHGKTTLSDSLLARAGLIQQDKAGTKCTLDVGEEEKERGVTIKSTAVSLLFERVVDRDNAPAADEAKSERRERCLVNLIDSPGHVDFSSEVTAALRITDGALVVVDCVEGVCVQTETVLRQALAEKIKPVLFLNKIDRIFTELHKEPEEAYENFQVIVAKVNEIIAQYAPEEDVERLEVSVEKGSVAFGSGIQTMGFTIDTWARYYAKLTGDPKEKWIKRLWGNHFIDSKTGKWRTKDVTKDGSRKLRRGFCEFVLEPLAKMTKHVMAENQEKVDKLLKRYGVEITAKQMANVKKGAKYYLRLIMGQWLPAGDNILDMLMRHLPNPAEAQAYRAATLYSGPEDDEACVAVKRCDPTGPLMFYVSKMVSHKNRFYALGRVFSGTMRRSDRVRILGPDYVVGEGADLFKDKSIGDTVIVMADRVESIESCPAGSICALSGVEKFINKNATITTLDSAHPFHAMKFSVSPVVQVAVAVKSARDLPKLVEGLKKLANADNIVQVTKTKQGENVVAGAGELHIETALHDLQNKYMKDVPITVSEPVVSYCESVSAESPEDLLAKSTNKLNRLMMRAEPMDAKLCADIEDGKVGPRDDFKARARYLADNFPTEWTRDDARKIWSFGSPADAPCNVLVNQTKGVDYIRDVQDTIVASFTRETATGILCDEPLRGVRFNIRDAKLHQDPAHRGGGAIMPMTRRVMCAAQLASKPVLLEPVFAVEIMVPLDSVSGVYSTLAKARGEIEEEVARDGALRLIRARLPVAESFGFNGKLRGATQGKAFPQMSFSHWQPVSGDPLDEGSEANRIVRAIRARKGMPERLPKVEDFHDRI